jgi:hypothetical protein
VKLVNKIISITLNFYFIPFCNKWLLNKITSVNTVFLLEEIMVNKVISLISDIYFSLS